MQRPVGLNHAGIVVPAGRPLEPHKGVQQRLFVRPGSDSRGRITGRKRIDRGPHLRDRPHGRQIRRELFHRLLHPHTPQLQIPAG